MLLFVDYAATAMFLWWTRLAHQSYLQKLVCNRILVEQPTFTKDK